MIGGITKGSCFSGCVEYALALKEKNKEARLLYSEGLLTDTPKDIIDGFECQRHLNSRVQHWCGHISLSYSPEDSARLSDEAMVKLALEYMEKMGIKNTQYIIVRHLDKEHPHCHIVYNRVDNDGRCVSDSFEYYRNNEICDEMKKKYGLTYGENKDQVKTERLKGRAKTRQEISYRRNRHCNRRSLPNRTCLRPGRGGVHPRDETPPKEKKRQKCVISKTEKHERKS